MCPNALIYDKAMQEFCQRQNKSYFLKSLILNKPIQKLRKPIKAPKIISCQPSTCQSHNWINEWLSLLLSTVNWWNIGAFAIWQIMQSEFMKTGDKGTIWITGSMKNKKI